MILDNSAPVREQIEAAVANGTPFRFDLRMEAMGDKCASVALIEFLFLEFGIDKIAIQESAPGRTPFMLADHWDKSDDRVTFEVMEPYVSDDRLDLHTTRQALPALWEFNAYLGAAGFNPTLPIERPDQPSSVVFAIRSEAEYDERKNMDLKCARLLIDEMKKVFANVVVLYDVEDPMFPEALHLPMRDALRHIESCRVFIGGDTGFTHYAAVCGIPTVAIYPDYGRFGKASWTKAGEVAEWWDIPRMRFTPFSCLPNASSLRVTELGTNHKWSIDHVMQSIKQLA